MSTKTNNHQDDLPRKASNTNIIRRHSDIRILGGEDLELAVIATERQDSLSKGLPVPKHEPSKDPHRVNDDFHFEHEGLSSERAKELLAQFGPNELPEKVIPKWYIFVSLLWKPMQLMIWAAIIIEAAIMNWLDMCILLFIQFGNAAIAFYETTKAGDAIAALKSSLNPEATVRRDHVWQQIDPRLIVPGDLVLLAAGSAVPADCRTNAGEIEVDQAALTGESLPVTLFHGDSCKMGSTVVRGEVNATVEFTGAETFFGKTASLLGETSEYSNMQKVLMKIMMILVVISIMLSSGVFIYIAIDFGVLEALNFTVVLLVASIPLAMEVVSTTTLALGSKELSRDGAIVARLAAIEDMAAMNILCSDKTGTLTKNIMEIQQDTPVYAAGETQYTLLRYAAMAAKWHEPPRDALDTLILSQADLSSLDEGYSRVVQESYLPFDPIIKRTEATITMVETGVQFKVTKGAPQVLLDLILADNQEEVKAHNLQEQVENDVQIFGSRGVRTLAVAKTNTEGKWNLLGMLTFLDPPRTDTFQTIADARKYGIMVKMITGDHFLIARETARVLCMGQLNPEFRGDEIEDNDVPKYLPCLIQTGDLLPLLDVETKVKPVNLCRDFGDMCLATDVFAQVFPEHKYLIVECLREMGYKVGMTGDGVNDAPALKRADVGVAVYGATDAARAAADIVLTEPGLSTIVHGVILARGIFMRIHNFLTYRIAATLQLLMFFFIAIFGFRPIDYEPSYSTANKQWPEFFHLPVLMLMLITLLNDGTLISIGYDNVIPNQTPCRWNLWIMFSIGIVLGGVACLSSLILLYGLLDSHNQSGWFAFIGLPGLSYGQITTSIYLKISISDFLTLFSARTGDKWFWESTPSPIVLMGALVALSMSTILAVSWPPSYIDHIYTVGLGREKPFVLPVYIWIYCLFWWLIQDIIKVSTYCFFKKNNIFDINNNGIVDLPASTKQFILDNQQYF